MRIRDLRSNTAIINNLINNGVHFQEKQLCIFIFSLFSMGSNSKREEFFQKKKFYLLRADPAFEKRVPYKQKDVMKRGFLGKNGG